MPWVWAPCLRSYWTTCVPSVTRSKARLTSSLTDQTGCHSWTSSTRNEVTSFTYLILILYCIFNQLLNNLSSYTSLYSSHNVMLWVLLWALLCGSYLPPTKEEVYVFARVRLSVCLSVCEQDYSKTRACICMKCWVSTDVGTWTNWLTFDPDPDHSPDPGTGLLSTISYVLQRGILLLPGNPTYMYLYT